MSNARDKANIPALNFSSTGIDDNATSTAITIDSSENVGLGTTSPSARFNILESTVGTDPTADSSNFIKLTNSDIGTVNEVFGIGFSSLSGGTDYLGAFVQALGNYSLNFNHSLIFGTRGTSGNATERMRIDSSGNVGIGTSSPENKLDVRGIVNCTNAGADASLAEVIRFARSDYPDFYHTIFASTGSGTSSEHKLDFRLNTGSSNTVTSRMTLLGNGNVGIGTTSPTSNLHVESSTGTALLKATGTDTGATLVLNGNKTSNTAGIGSIQFQNNGDSVGMLRSFRESANDAGGLSFWTQATGGANSERMRINSSGNVGIGTSSPSSSYRLSTVGGTGGAVVGAFIETTSTTSGHEASIIKRPNSGVLVQFLGSGQVGSITTNGSTTTYGTSSDYRLKENIVEITDATARLKQLKPKRFNFIADADTTVDGFLAHEVSSVVPEAIHGTKDEIDTDGNPKYQNIDQSKLVPLLVKTIQELEARITTLEANNP